MPQLKEDNPIISPGRRENIILSSVLYNRECREYSIQNRLPENLFSRKEVKKIIEIFNGLVNANLAPSLDMLIEQYYPNDKDELSRKRLKKNLSELKEACPPVKLDVFKEHIFLLKKHNNLDRLERIMNEVITKIVSERNNPSFNKKNESFDFLSQKLDEILDDFTPEEIKSLNLGEGLIKQLEKINEMQKDPEKTEACPTGFSSLDKALSGGFRKGNFTLISARPSVGKTAFMLNTAVESAKQGNKVLFISIEMTLSQCLQRLLSMLSSVKLHQILQPDSLSQLDVTNLEETVKEAAKLFGDNLFIEEVTSITPSQLESRIKFYQKQFGVDLVFVDYLQIMRTNSGKVPTEESDFSGLSYSLRETSKALNVAIVLGAQLSRKVEEREDKRPMDSDLRNSGTFEQDAVAIIHLYRDAVYNPDTVDKNILEIIIGKNRFGTSNTTLRFSYDYSIQTIYQNAPAA